MNLKNCSRGTKHLWIWDWYIFEIPKRWCWCWISNFVGWSSSSWCRMFVFHILCLSYPSKLFIWSDKERKFNETCHSSVQLNKYLSWIAPGRDLVSAPPLKLLMLLSAEHCHFHRKSGMHVNMSRNICTNYKEVVVLSDNHMDVHLRICKTKSYVCFCSWNYLGRWMASIFFKRHKKN